MEFRVLGQIEVWRDGQHLTLGSVKQRMLLALLLVHVNEAISTDHIIDELWRNDPATDRHNALWVHVSKLRSILDPGRERRSDGTVLCTRSPGYVLRAEPDQVDATRFEQLVQEGRSIASVDPAVASLVLAEGLALWRGRPYEDLLYESFLQGEVTRLDELRMEAVELRLDAQLSCGRSQEVVGELQGLVREHPLREHLAAQLMLALYRSGRQAEALRTYSRLRALLGDELGLDPSTALQLLERQMLCADPDLDERSVSGRSAGRPAVRGYELREEIGTSALGSIHRAYQPAVGREVALTIVRPSLTNDPRFIRRFSATADAAMSLRHPNLVVVEDLWREPDGAYLVTPLVTGYPLAAALADGPLPLATAVTIIVEVGSALSVAHRRGFVHGNINLETVIVEHGHGFLAGLGFVPIGTDPGAVTPQPLEARWCTAPEQLAGATLAPTADVYSLALVLERALSGEPGPADAAPSAAIPDAVAGVIAQASAAAANDRPPDAAVFVAALRDAVESLPATTDVSEEDHPVNPFKGLRAFGEADAAEFFGRERVVERLLARLGVLGSAGRFAAVVGASGSGKSSVVRAGLVPAIRAGALPGSAEWFVVEITPGRHPFEELAAGLGRVAVDPAGDLVEQLTSSPSGLRRVLHETVPDAGTPLLLVIDQFEELFTVATPIAARALMDALTDAVLEARGRLRLVITLRADFYDRPLNSHAFADLLRKGTELIGAMSPEELRLAVEGPVDRLGVRFEPGLVARLVADVVDRPAALPLLQFALTELFDRRPGRSVELRSYLELGGAAGALAHQADAVYESLDVNAREMTRQVLLRLVNVGDDDATRRRVLLSELAGLGDERVRIVVDTLAAHRLLSLDRDGATRSPTVEIAHEALFTEWGRLRAWIAESRDDVRRHHQIAAAAEEWQRAGGANDYLLRGGRIEELLAFVGRTDIRLTGKERAFVEASVDHRDTERAAVRTRQKDEARLRRTSRRRMAVLVGGAVALIAATTVAGSQIAHSRAADRVAMARDDAKRLAAASADVAHSQPELAMLLALQSLASSARGHLPAGAEGQDALQLAIQGAGLTYPTAHATAFVRDGPGGLTGMFRLPLADLVALARGHITRGFTIAECRHYAIEPCPSGDRGLASPASTGPPVLPEVGPTSAPAPILRPLAGTSVTMLDDAWGNTALGAELQAFTTSTGINVDLVRPRTPTNSNPVGSSRGPGLGDALDPVLDRLPDGSRPDVTLSYSPGTLRDLAAEGRLIDLTTYLDPATVRSQIGDEFTAEATVGTGLYWLPLNFDLEGLVWYPRKAFAQAGYQVPRTMGELAALARQMVADGRTPWCLGTERGPFSGWPVTDWLEAMVLRVGGVSLYDRWTRHDMAFDDRGVRQAGELVNTVLFAPGFISGGTSLASQLDPIEAMALMLRDEPACWMHEGGSYEDTVLPFLGHEQLGEDIDYFPLPPIEAGTTPITEGGAVSAAAMSDRPEVRELMRFLASPDWGQVGARQQIDGFIPPRPRFDVTSCVDPSSKLAANAVRVRLCQDSRAAISNGTWRLDASDQMPVAIGGVDANDHAGAFLKGMLDWVAQGPDSLEPILSKIDKAWP